MNSNSIEITYPKLLDKLTLTCKAGNGHEWVIPVTRLLDYAFLTEPSEDASGK